MERLKLVKMRERVCEESLLKQMQRMHGVEFADYQKP